MKFKIIVATDQDQGIGKNNQIPWNLSEDLKNFRKLTVGDYPDTTNAIIMGRNTWDSLPKKPLPNRLNIIITSRPESLEQSESVLVFDSFQKALNDVQNRSLSECFIIGGTSIYEQALKLDIVSDIYQTEIFDNYQCDRFFPKINGFKIVSESESRTGYISGIKYKFRHLTRYNQSEKSYLNLCREILNKGAVRKDRTGTGTISLFGKSLEFSLANDCIPLLTTKKMAWKTICKELLWFISGSTNSKILEKQGVKIWQGNTSREFLDRRGLGHLPEGDIGAGYGFQWRHFGAKYIDMNTDYTGQGVDQLTEVIKTIKNDPHSRRIILNAWNVADLDKMALPPCHMMVQFYVDQDRLSATMYQRSADIFLGVPFNIASYALLVHLIAKICDLKADRLIMNFGDVHVYENHRDAVLTQLSRVPNLFPKVKISNVSDIDQISLEQIELSDYQCHGSIKADMAI